MCIFKYPHSGWGGLLCGIFIKTKGTKPFHDMTADMVESVTAELVSLGAIIHLTGKDTQQFVALMQEAVVYEKDDSYTEYAGQSVVFTITKTEAQPTTYSFHPPPKRSCI